MSDGNNVFGDEWRKCLREHYKYVIRNEDNLTRKTLEPVLGRVGFGDDELRQLRVEATLRAEDVPEDFVPDLNILEAGSEADVSPQVNHPPENPAHPLECQCPACIEINRIPHDEEGQPLDEAAREEFEAEQAEARNDDGEKPQQLSLF